MPYLLIKGEFHIFYPDSPRNGPEPDGDTMRFRPDNPQLVNNMPTSGAAPNFNKRHMVSLRFEAIDALETHYNDTHQHLGWATAARDALLAACGFGKVRFWQRTPNKVSSVEHHPTRGYIAVNGTDSHGRLVCFVFAGDPSEADGTALWLDEERVLQSLNAHLLREGLVYPAFYTSLPPALRTSLKALANAGRTARRGLWQDAVPVGQEIAIKDLVTLQQLVLWPKLFRRLASYFAAGYSNLDQFDAWLRQDPTNRDDSILLPHYEIGNMHDIVSAQGQNLRLNYEPEDLIILPDGQSTHAPLLPAHPAAQHRL